MIILAATPLGNPADASSRLRELLADADILAAEDTRRARRLAADLDVTITGQVVSFYEAVEREKTPWLLAQAEAGATVVVISDAGTPVVSDPGYRLVAAAVQAGVPVGVAPGPSAVTAALSVSGLPTDRFTFEGFLPRKAGERARLLAELAGEPRTMVFFESPRRTHATLAQMADAFGPQRAAVVCRELTKTYEQVLRGTLAELVATTSAQVLGEVTIVVAGAGKTQPAIDAAVLAAAHAEAVASGIDHKVAMREVARQFGVPKRQVYEAVLAARRT